MKVNIEQLAAAHMEACWNQGGVSNLHTWETLDSDARVGELAGTRALLLKLADQVDANNGRHGIINTDSLRAAAEPEKDTVREAAQRVVRVWETAIETSGLEAALISLQAALKEKP